jgi:hypothetical protein
MGIALGVALAPFPEVPLNRRRTPSPLAYSPCGRTDASDHRIRGQGNASGQGLLPCNHTPL